MTTEVCKGCLKLVCDCKKKIWNRVYRNASGELIWNFNAHTTRECVIRSSRCGEDVSDTLGPIQRHTEPFPKYLGNGTWLHKDEPLQEKKAQSVAFQEKSIPHVCHFLLCYEKCTGDDEFCSDLCADSEAARLKADQPLRDFDKRHTTIGKSPLVEALQQERDFVREKCKEAREVVYRKWHAFQHEPLLGDPRIFTLLPDDSQDEPSPHEPRFVGQALEDM